MIQGAGKNTGGEVPYTAPELVRSIGTARILDLVCEGPIVGLINGDSSVFIDGTPLKDPASGKYNFLKKDGVTPAVTVIATNTGTPNQGYIPGFDQVESEVAVGATVFHDQPVTRTIEPGIDRIRLRLSTPALYIINAKGETDVNSIKYLIEVKDSTTPNFPDAAEQAAALVAKSLTIPLWTTPKGHIGSGNQITMPPDDNQVSTPYLIPAMTGYGLVVQLDLSSWATGSSILSQLTYALRIRNQIVAPVIMEIFGQEVDRTDWRSISTSVFPGCPVGDTWSYGWVASRTVNVFRMNKIQFRFKQNTPGGWIAVNGFGATGRGCGATFKGTFSSSASNYAAIVGPEFNGQHPSKFEISTYDYDLPGVGPWMVRVSKITEDSIDVKTQQTLQWDTYTEIIDSKLSYPNRAVFGVIASAEQFSSIPTRGYHCRLLMVKVPSNYFPADYDHTTNTWTPARYTRNALGQDTGVEQGWDGTFYVAYTSNPAWCYYDLLTNTRYGLGRRIQASKVDKWALYRIARYCDGMVDSGYSRDGVKLQEPRFTLNCYITTRYQAYTLLQYFTSAFRGMVYWAAGQVTAVQDSPTDPVHEFTNADVLKGTFTYSGTAKRARHTAALVTWNDPEQQYQQVTEYVDDPEGIRRYGYNPTTVPAFGCTSRGQAHRFGRWVLYSELNETETCTHRTGLEGVHVVPGDVYKVADIARSGVRWQGRVSSAESTSRVTIDGPVTLEAGKEYIVSFVKLTTPPALETVAIPVSDVDRTDVILDLATPLEAVPAPGTPWVIECPAEINAQLFRCISCNEVESGTFEVIGLAHNPGKFAMVEENLKFDPRPISGQLPVTTVIAPTGVEILEEDRLDAMGALKKHLYVTWNISPHASIKGYDAEYSQGGGIWLKAVEVATNKCELLGPAAGTYSARVRSINAFGIPSEWIVTSHTVSQRKEKAPNVSGLQLLGQGNNTTFTDRDARFAWKRPMPVSAVADSLGDDSYGVGQAYPSDWLAGYVIRILNLDGTVRRTDTSSSEQYTYSFDKNLLDGNGVPVRSFTIEVSVRTVWGDVSEIPARLTVSNPAPAVLT